MTWFLDLRQLPAGGDPVRHVDDIKVYQATAGKPMGNHDLKGLLAAVRGKDVLLGTHGFEVPRQNGIDELSRWEGLLSLPDSAAFVAVLWPGDARIRIFLDYPWEDDEAKRSGELLAQFVNGHFTAAGSVSYCSHSLGARVVLEAVAGTSLKVRRLIIMAGAIDDDCLHNQYADAVKRVDEISVLASDMDFVLAAAFPLGNPVAGLIDVGHPYWSAALGRNGPDIQAPPGLQSGWQIIDSWNYGHLDYLGDAPGRVDRSVDVPSPGDPKLKKGYKPAWSAAFVSTRFSRP